MPLLSVHWINSWWWTDELSEICQFSWQNKFVELVHLDGFITKKNPIHRETQKKYTLFTHQYKGAVCIHFFEPLCINAFSLKQIGFLEILVYQKYIRQWTLPNMTCCIVRQLSVLCLENFSTLFQVCSWLFLAPIKTFLSWCMCFLVYLRNKSITNEKIYRKHSSITNDL
jgi:hypothetical protein